MKENNKYMDQIEEIKSNFLIDSWSYSKIETFARNEKAFEMQYIYGLYSKKSANTYAGTAYHDGLKAFFNGIHANVKVDLVDMEQVAFNTIDELPANEWKLQKTTPTINDCIQAAIKTSSELLRNFIHESDVYLSEIDEIIFVEEKLSQWVSINGVDIPLPCNLVIDLAFKNKEGKIIIVDHKTKRTFTDEEEIKFTGGKQAIVYTLGFEEATNLVVDEVWFIENKYSKNRDSSPQLKVFKIQMDIDTRRLYEAIVYEPLRRMLEAISNPDYIYVMNDRDTFVDMAEMYEFWTKTMLAEIEDFNIPDERKELIKERLKKIRDTSLTTITPTVLKNFRKFTEQFIPYDLSNKDMTNEEKIEHILRSFGVVAKVQHKLIGYSSASYLLEVNAGVALNTVQRYKLDIANALNVSNVRIMKDLFVYEGKSYLAVESSIKRTKNLMFDSGKLNGHKIPLGEDNFGNVIYWDMDNPSTPHMLVCGATGSGKSVSLRSTIEFSKLAGIEEIIIFDPKFEFVREYSGDKNIKVISDIEDIELEMMMLVEKMNQMVKSGFNHKTLVVFDEFADAVANSRKGNELKNYSQVQNGQYANGMIKYKRVCTSTDKSLEENLRILLQKGRSTGFRIIAATQRASAKVITGDAKVNFPVLVSFRVPKEVDSMVVLDETGAESLTGKGDGLIKSPEYIDTIRFQAFFKSN